MSARDEERQMSELDRSALVAEARRDALHVARHRNEDLDGSAGYTDSGEGVDAPSAA